MKSGDALRFNTSPTTKNTQKDQENSKNGDSYDHSESKTPLNDSLLLGPLTTAALHYSRSADGGYHSLGVPIAIESP
jgi:hypothetical protein